jgi:ribonuclease P protein component
MDEIRHTLPKKERLCGKTAISMLLAKGRHGKVTGLRYCFRPDSGAEENRIMVSVPKKMFKRAVKRNLLKRRIRESWRKQKHALAGLSGYVILFTYSQKEELSYEEIYEAVGKVIQKVRHSAESKEAERNVTAE